MTLHPQARSFLDMLAENNAPPWSELSPTEGRELFSSLTDFWGDAPDVQQVEDCRVNDDVSVRVYRPCGEGPFPALVYFHGGGWVLGNLETHDALCRRLANATSSVVVAVDYRLSPETVFPGAMNDCYAATQFVSEQANRLNVDPGKIVVVGDSAGGNLATGVAIMARDRGGPKIHFQLLIYPVTDHRCDSASFSEFAEGCGLTKASMQWFWQQYLGESGDGNEPLASPLLTADLKGLPAAHVITAQYDVLRDEGEAYVDRLRSAGVPTTHRRYDGMIHGFVHFASVFDAGRQAVDDFAAVIRDANL